MIDSNGDSGWASNAVLPAWRSVWGEAYCGTRANLFDLRRCSAIQNLETTQAVAAAQAA